MKNTLALSLALIALGVLSWLILKPTTQVSFGNGETKDRSFTVRAETLALQGKPIVLAIYKFKNDCGLWPATLEELVPAYVAKPDIRNWRYDWKPTGQWQLTNYFDFPHKAVRYQRGNSAKGWTITDGMHTMDLKVDQPTPSEHRHSEKELSKNMQAQMSKRVANDPRKIVHHKGLICWLVTRKKLAEARAACLSCLDLWPDHWWPTLMLGIIEAQLGNTSVAETRMSQLVEKKQDFNHYYLLGYHFLTTDQTPAAFKTWSKAAQFKFSPLRAEWQSTGENLGIGPTFFPWQAVTTAYQEKRYDVALVICDQWERYRTNDNPSADASFFAIRAACYLAIGKLDNARVQIDKADQAEETRRNYAQHLDALRKAIEQCDTGFVYNPGSFVAFSPLIQYE